MSIRAAVGCLFCSVLISSTLCGQETATAPVPKVEVNLPDGKQLLEDYLEVTGGKEKRAAIKSQQMIGKLKMSIPGAGDIEAPITVQQAKPNKFQMIVDLTKMGAGTMNQGTDGEVAWDIGPQGARLLEGEMKERTMKRADMTREIDPAANYSTIESVAEENIDGKKTYKVKFTPKDGTDDEYRFFDAETKLMVKTITKQKTPMGAVDVETTVADYRDVNGMKMAFRNEVMVELPGMKQKQIIAFDEIKINADMPSDAFQVPAAIQEIIAERAAKPPE